MVHRGLVAALCFVLVVACAKDRVYGGGSADGAAGAGGDMQSGSGGAGTGGTASGGMAGGDAGGSEAGGSGGLLGSGGHTQDVPVEVASSEPANDDVAVRPDASVVISFNQPMDPTTVEAAYASDELPANAVTFEWDAAKTVLTVVPSAPLGYAEVYSISLATTAKALGGGELAAPWNLTFKTAQHGQVVFAPQEALSGYWRSSGSMGQCSSYDLCIGDGQGNDQYRSFLSFDISTLPATLVDIVSAELVYPCSSSSGAPFTMAPLIFESVQYSAVGSTAFSATALSQAGSFSTQATSFTVDVTPQVADDYEARAARSGRSQYRVGFSTASDNDGFPDVCLGYNSGVSLAVEYLTP